MLQLAHLVADRIRGRFYETVARRILSTLCRRYLAEDDADWEGILKGGVYHVAKNLGVNESVMWGEYFFVEALDEVLRESAPGG